MFYLQHLQIFVRLQEKRGENEEKTRLKNSKHPFELAQRSVEDVDYLETCPNLWLFDTSHQFTES